MSFRNPFGPLGPVNGPDLLQDDRVVRADVHIPADGVQTSDWPSVAGSITKGAALFVGATIALTVLLFVPVFYGEVSSIEVVGMNGESLTASEFVSKLKNMLFGTGIVAFSLVSLIASAAFASRYQGIRVVDDRPASSQVGGVDPVLAALIKVRHV